MRRTGETLPAEVRGLLDARLAGLGDVPRQVLGAAAAIGRSFDLDTRPASQRAKRRGDRGCTRGAGRRRASCARSPDRSPSTTSPTSKLRALVYEQTGLARRRLLHARVAAALSGPRPDGESAALVAQHLRLAGDHARRCRALPSRRGARRIAARSRRRARPAGGGTRPWLPGRRRGPRADRRPAYAARRLWRRAGRLRERRRAM